MARTRTISGLATAFLFLATLIFSQAFAHSPNCLRAPYGASQAQFETFIEAAASGAQSSGPPPAVMVNLAKAELRMACAAKYKHAGLPHYAALGISTQQIARDSVTQLAEIDMTAENHRIQQESQPVSITVSQFAINGPTMAKNGAAVSIQGAYARDGSMEYLFGDQQSAIEAEDQDGTYPYYIPRVVLLTEDAKEAARSALLQCAQTQPGETGGCFVTVVGTVTTCVETTVYGGSKQVPCLDVQRLGE